MDRTKIEYPLVVFLYAYLQQIDLSLDRSRWTSLDELRDYYKTQIAPGRVADYLLRKFDLDSKEIDYVYYVTPLSSSAKVVAWCELHFKRGFFLSNEEVYYCCQKLLVLEHYLSSSREVHKLEIEKLRVEFSQFTFGVLHSRIFLKDRFKAQHVEHFLQSENLDVISMEKFSTSLDLF